MKIVTIFRRWKDTHDVIALFPFESHNATQCMSYMHVGQHGGADYAHVVRATRPCKARCYDGLDKELTGIGYRLDIRQRKPKKAQS
jgi:hypothetical protein